MYYIKTILRFFLIATALFFIQNSQAYEALDRTVAVVEDDVILLSELDQRIEHLSRKQPNIEITDKIKKEVLDQLITEKLRFKLELLEINCINWKQMTPLGIWHFCQDNQTYLQMHHI